MFNHLIGVLLLFSWSANAPADNVTGYRLLFGATEGNYTAKIDVGNVTTKQVDVDTSKYKFVAVSAVNALGESDPSDGVIVIRPTKPARPSVAPAQ